MFKNLNNDGMEESSDRLGGYRTFDSDVYPAIIKMAYADSSTGGAQNVTVVLEIEGREYEETIYITSKEGKNYYLDKNDKTKKHPLPGFTTIDDICLVATGEPLNAQDEHVEEKLVKVYDKDTKTRIPKNKPVLTALIGKTVGVAINKVLENKGIKQNDNSYVDGPETRESNAIDKVFDVESKMSVAEARHGRPAEFWDAWVKQNKGRVIDKRTIKDGVGGAGTAGRPPQSKGASMQNAGAPAAGSTPKRSLFGAKAAAA